MPALLKWPSRPCHGNDTGISTRNTSPSLSVTYSGYKECTFGPRASRRLLLWSIHPPKEKSAQMSSSSSCSTEIIGLVRSGTCQMLCNIKVEPPDGLSSTVSIPIMAQCWEFLARTESECRAEYYRNWDWCRITWYDTPNREAKLWILRSYTELLIWPNSQWIGCSVRWIIFRLKSRKNWPPPIAFPFAMIFEPFILGLLFLIFDMSRIFVVIACSRAPRLSCICRLSGRTSSLTVWSVGRTLYTT